METFLKNYRGFNIIVTDNKALGRSLENLLEAAQQALRVNHVEPT